MAINVNHYGTGGRCVYMFKYAYAGIRIINMQPKPIRQNRDSGDSYY